MRLRDEHKEAAIRRKAMQLIVKHGFDGLSMGKLAKAAKVSPATIYIYFKDRDDMIRQLCSEESGRMVAATLRDFSPDMDFEAGMRLQWKNRFSYWIDNPTGAQFLEQAKHSPYGEEAMKYVRDEFANQMGAFIHKAFERREVRRMSAEVFWSLAYAPLYALIKFHLGGRGLGRSTSFVLTDDILEEALQLSLKALKL